MKDIVGICYSDRYIEFPISEARRFALTSHGLPAAACNGMPYKRLTEVAQTAGRFIVRELEADDSKAVS